MDALDNYYHLVYNDKGNVEAAKIINSQDVYNSHDDEAFYAIKYELFYQIHPKHDLMVGTQIQTTNHWIGTSTFLGSQTRYKRNIQNPYDTSYVYTNSPYGDITNSLSFGDANKMFAYISDKYRITPSFNLTFGLRYDYFSYSRQGQFSPRGSIAYELIPVTTTLSLSAGDYWQTQPLPDYADRKNLGINKYLENERSQHIVLGLQHILDEGIKFSVETYYKKFSVTSQ